MDCQNWREDISAYLDDELSRKKVKNLLRHFETCPECQKELKGLMTQKERLATLRASCFGPLPTQSFAQGVMAAIDRQDALAEPKKTLFIERVRAFFSYPAMVPRYTARFALAAVVCVTLAMGWGIYSRNTQNSPVLLSVYDLQPQPAAEKIKMAKWTRSDDSIVLHHLTSSSAATVGAKPCLLEYAAYTSSSLER